MQKTLSVVLSLQDRLTNRLSGISGKTRTIVNDFRDIGTAIDRAFQGGSADSLASSVTSAFARMETEAKGSIRDIAADIEDGIADAADDVADNIDNIGDSFRGLGDNADGISGAADQMGELGSKSEQTTNSMGRLDERSNSLTGTLKALFTAIAAGAAVNKLKQFAEDSYMAFSEFDSGMGEVATMMPDASEEQLRSMQQQARGFSKDMGVLTTESVPALYQALSAGVSPDTVFDFMENAQKAALGGVSTLETAVDGLTSVTNAYGKDVLSTQQASDYMFTTVRLGKTNFEQLAGSLYNVVPTAVGANVAFSDVSAALAAMTAQGVPTSVATTQLRQAIVELSSAGTETDKLFREIAGESFKDFIKSGGNLQEALQKLEKYAKDSNLGVNDLFSSVEAGNAALSLTGTGTEKFTDSMEAMQNSTGATEAAYDRMAQTLEHKADLLKASWEDVKLSAGESLGEALEPAMDGLLNNMDDIKGPFVELFANIGDLITEITPMMPGLINVLADGLSALSGVLIPLFKTIAQNPKAVGTALSSIGAAIGTYKLTKSVPGMASGLKNVLGVLVNHPWAAGAGAVAGAITAIGVAYKSWEKEQMDLNLAEHFGDISLAAEEAREVASQILKIDYLGDLQLSNKSFEEADRIFEEANDALQKNDYLEWKCRVGMTLTDDEQESYVTNMNTFAKGCIETLEKKEYAAEISVKAILGNTESAQLIAEMQAWFAEDKAELVKLSGAITGIMQNALDSGMSDVNTQAAIDILQMKMLSIVNAQKEIERAAQLDYLTLTSSGAALDKDSWVSVVEELDTYRQTAKEESSGSYKDLLGYFEAAKRNNHIDEGRFNNIMDLLGTSIKNQEATLLSESWGWLSSSINEAYGKELDTAGKNMETTTQDKLQSISETMQGAMNGAWGIESVYPAMESAFSGVDSGLAESDKSALLNRYETMLPTVEEMAGVIDQAKESGQAVPQALMDSYNQAVSVGAAAGDTNAMWQYMASQLIESGGYEDFMAQVEALGVKIPDEFQKAIDRASVETSETADFSKLWENIIASMGEDGSIDLARVDQLLGQYGYTISSYIQEKGLETDAYGKIKVKSYEFDASEAAQQLSGLESTGNTFMVNGELMVEYEVTVGQTLSEIAQEAGITLDELIAANPQIENPNVIDIGQKINIPASAIEVDASSTEPAIEKAAQEAATGSSVVADVNVTANPQINPFVIGGYEKGLFGEAELIPFPVTAKAEVTNVDTTAVEEAGEQVGAAAGAAIDESSGQAVTAASNLGTETNNAAASALANNEAVNTAASSLGIGIAEAIDGSAGAASASATNLGNRVIGALKAALSTSIAVSLPVAISVIYTVTGDNFNLLNGGIIGTGAFSIVKHALGGIFDAPHIGMVAEAGPEAIIPLDGSDHAFGLWQKAGELLGMFTKPLPGSISTLPPTHGQQNDYTIQGPRGADRSINLNINGSGSLKVSGDVPKEKILDVVLNNIKGIIMDILEEEIVEEGEMSYEY